VFNSTYGYMGIDRLVVAQDEGKAMEYAELSGVRPDVIVVTVNDQRYGGAGGFLTTLSRGGRSSVMLHEFGHVFGRLADEYVDENIKDNYPLAGAAEKANVDTTRNPREIKWKHLIGLPGLEQVGVHEGGFYRASGVFRPQAGCIMNGQSEDFCVVCQETIVRRICELTDIEFSLDRFLAMMRGGTAPGGGATAHADADQPRSDPRPRTDPEPRRDPDPPLRGRMGGVEAPRPLVERASFGGRYSDFLFAIPHPASAEEYGQVFDGGYFDPRAEGAPDLPAGYWVYYHPYWIIWGSEQTE
jgi:hypothetical protein